MTKEQTRFENVCLGSGWKSDCARSPLPSIASTEGLLADGKGWEGSANDCSPKQGYEYALEESSRRRGFKGVAERVYFRRVRRKIKA